MLNTIIRFALKQRLLIVAISVALIGYGSWQMLQMEIDVFPNLNRPRVTVMTEAHGLAPEEVETLITIPIESVLNGANGVQTVRSSSGVGISIVYVEFDWGTDIYTDRQIVAERLALASERLPPGISPQLAPISSIMGQIMMIGMWVDHNSPRADTAEKSTDDRKMNDISDEDALELRTLADWVVRPRLLTIPGVSQVFTMGGGRKQFQILVNPDDMLRYGVTLHDVKQAVAQSNENATGGYLDDQGPNEILVRALGRVQSVEDLEKLVVHVHRGQPIPLRQVARVVEAAQVKRGDSSAFVRRTTDIDGDRFSGGPAVVLTINKQPNADTREISDQISVALAELQKTLPEHIRIQTELYSQKSFIDRSIANITESLIDGGILVVVILFLFLLNFRTTLITLTSIPVSVFIAVLIFSAFGLSVNTMTLGGLAVAVGELMDDAIVDVENIFRRLRENQRLGNPKSNLLVVYQASVEIRNSIVFGTMIVVLGFLPLFALSGMVGRLFTPLAIAYIVAILSSLVVSLTLTPVLSYWLLPSSGAVVHVKDGLILSVLKRMAGWAIRLSLRFPGPVLVYVAVMTGVAALFAMNLDQHFLPPFNEGTVQLNVILPPGTSLQKSNEIARTVESRLKEIEDVESFVRRTGRAELDEHAEGVNTSELIINIDPDSERTREEILVDIRAAMKDIPGIVISAEQPLAHLIAHMLSGVRAQVGIKLYGDDLAVLRQTADRMKAAISDVDGIAGGGVQIEPQVIIPQYRIQLDRDKLLLYGLTPTQVSELVETAMNGDVVSSVLTNQRTFDLLVRLDEKFREDLQAIERLAIEIPGGAVIPLSAVAKIYESGGPNSVKRERVRRRIVLQCNVSGRGLVDVVKDIQQKLKPIQDNLPSGYRIEYGGLFKSQQRASERIMLLFCLMLFAVFLVLFTMFRSANFSLQVMAALPMAFIGAVAALVISGQMLTIAAMVGFISLGGIASRNGILLLNHYIHLVRYEGETWSKEMVVRAGEERLAPVLMTALTSGIGLIPLVLTAGEAGKEILFPIATVHIGGLISCTLLEFFVRPALFWSFGRKAGKRIVTSAQDEILLDNADAIADPIPGQVAVATSE